MAKPVRVKKIPQRKCIVCAEHNDKKELVRIVKNKEGMIFYDASSKANGRGAYICKTRECFDKLRKSDGISRAFKCKVVMDIYDEIEKAIFKNDE